MMSIQNSPSRGAPVGGDRSLSRLARKIVHFLKTRGSKNRNVEHQKILGLGSRKDRFTEIYRKNFWQGLESKSGAGSDLKQTRSIRSALPGITARYQIASIVDAPCGDFNWMQHTLAELGCDYIGLDIVEDLIKSNVERYQNQKVSFRQADLCADPLPAGDLYIVRDFLFHLSYADIDRFLQNLAQCDYKYLLTTNHPVGAPGDFANRDILTGEYRRIDLFSAPFDFQPDGILDRIDESVVRGGKPRELVMLAKANVPTRLAQAG